MEQKYAKYQDFARRMLAFDGNCTHLDCRQCPLDGLPHSNTLGVPGVPSDTGNPKYLKAKLAFFQKIVSSPFEEELIVL